MYCNTIFTKNEKVATNQFLLCSGQLDFYYNFTTKSDASTSKTIIYKVYKLFHLPCFEMPSNCLIVNALRYPPPPVVFWGAPNCGWSSVCWGTLPHLWLNIDILIYPPQCFEVPPPVVEHQCFERLPKSITMTGIWCYNSYILTECNTCAHVGGVVCAGWLEVTCAAEMGSHWIDDSLSSTTGEKSVRLLTCIDMAEWQAAFIFVIETYCHIWVASCLSSYHAAAGSHRHSYRQFTGPLIVFPLWSPLCDNLLRFYRVDRLSSWALYRVCLVSESITVEAVCDIGLISY